MARATRIGGQSNYPYNAKSYAALQGANPQVDGDKIYLEAYYEGSKFGGGMFMYVASDTTTPDDGGSVCVTTNGKRLFRICQNNGWNLEDFGADPTGATDSTVAIQRAVNAATYRVNSSGNYLSKAPVNVLYGSANAKYVYSNTITYTRAIRVVGVGRGLRQGAGTNTGVPDRLDNPDDTAFMWHGPENIPCWSGVSEGIFDGLVFAFPTQNYAAQDVLDIKRLGFPVLKQTQRNLQVLNCVYYGCWNFVDTVSECLIAINNYGYAAGTDYKLLNSADVNRIINCHVNANVARGDLTYARVAALNSDTSFFVDLDRHDETIISQCHAMSKGTLIRTKGAGRLNGLNVSECVFDQSGALLDADVDSATHVAFSNCTYYHAYAWNTPTLGSDGRVVSRTIRADAGCIVLRKSTSNNFSHLKLTNLSINISNAPLSPERADYVFNFTSSTGWYVNLNGVHVPSLGVAPAKVMKLNNSLSSNQWYEDAMVVIGVRSYKLRASGRNYLRNPTAGTTDAEGKVSYWTTSGATLNSVGRITATAATGGYALARTNRSMNSRTFYAVATSIGVEGSGNESAGIQYTSYNADFSQPVSGSAPWNRIGNLYYAVVNVTGSRAIHDLRVMAGSNGNVVVLQYAGLFEGNQLIYHDHYKEIGPDGTQGSTRWSVNLTAGVAYTIPNSYCGDKGAVCLRFNGDNGVGEYRMMRRFPDAAVNHITAMQTDISSSETITIDWPSSSRPRITSALGGAYTLNVTQA